ncbi:MAG: amidohydrolase [Acidobacteriaceae bacterium]
MIRFHWTPSWSFCCLLVAAPLLAATPPPVVAIYYHGNVLTGVGLGQAHGQRATAIAVGAHEIVAVGNDATVLRQKQSGTRLFDLKGGFVMPGINDAHVHMAYAGQNKLAVDLTGSTSLADMLKRVSTAADHALPGQWLLGGGWDHTLWAGQTLPTRQDLDTVSHGHPAFFVRVDGHIAVANSVALAMSGVTRQTPDPPGSQFDHDAHGELTGIVRESRALDLIQQHVPPPTHEMRRQAILLAIDDAAAHGVTSVQDNSSWDDFLVYQELEREGRLKVRITEWLRFEDPVTLLEAQRAAQPAADRMLHTGMLKGFMDGSLGSRTAALLAPYADDPGNSGLPRYQQAQLDAMTKERVAAGFQIGFHAIGDRAVEMALNAFAAAARNVADFPARRERIEHSQVVEPQDIPRYKALGVVSSMQPSHLLTDMNWAEARLGPQRARDAYAWKAFLDAGVPLAFGTDYPVEPINPFRGIYAGVTRSNEAGNRSYFPQDKLTIGQVLLAYTQGSAYAEFSDTYKGRLAAGFVADFVVLDRDLTTVGAREILKARVLRTVVDGQTVYQAPVGNPQR